MIRNLYVFLGSILASAFAQSTAAPGDTTLITKGLNGAPVNGDGFHHAEISVEGRYIAFDSSASNLAPQDTNGVADIFVYDRETNRIERVSISSTGEQSDRESALPSISADGRYVAFQSRGTTLVPDDKNNRVGEGEIDIFFHDRKTGQTKLVSVNNAGEQAIGASSSPSLSADGRYVAFKSFASNLIANANGGIFVHDLKTGNTILASVNSTSGKAGNKISRLPKISSNGRYVVYASRADNLVPNATRGWNIFVHDLNTSQTELVSINSKGQRGNTDSGGPAVISADGRFIAFGSSASNLVTGDTNNKSDVFVHDRQTGQTERVNINTDGKQANRSASVVSISASGRHVVFQSEAFNLAPLDNNQRRDVFVYDRQTKRVQRVSISSTGAEGNDHSTALGGSADGRFVAFASLADNLVAKDSNQQVDIFIHEPVSPIAPVP